MGDVATPLLSHTPDIGLLIIGIPISLPGTIIEIHELLRRDPLTGDRRYLPGGWLAVVGEEVVHPLQSKLIREAHAQLPGELQQPPVQGEQVANPAGLYEGIWKVRSWLHVPMHLHAELLPKGPTEIHRTGQQLNQEVHHGEAADIIPNQPSAEAPVPRVTTIAEAAIDHQVLTNPEVVPVAPGLRPDEVRAEAVHQVQDLVHEVPVEAVPGLLQGSSI